MTLPPLHSLISEVRSRRYEQIDVLDEWFASDMITEDEYDEVHQKIMADHDEWLWECFWLVWRDSLFGEEEPCRTTKRALWKVAAEMQR